MISTLKILPQASSAAIVSTYYHRHNLFSSRRFLSLFRVLLLFLQGIGDRRRRVIVLFFVFVSPTNFLLGKTCFPTSVIIMLKSLPQASVDAFTHGSKSKATTHSLSPLLVT